MLCESRSRVRQQLRLLCALVVSVAVSVTSACSECNSGDSTEAEPSERWPLDSKLASSVPNSARAVLFVRHLGEVREVLTFLESRLGDRGPGASMLQSLLRTYRPHALGLSPDAEAVAFVRNHHVGIVAPLEAPKRLKKRLREMANRGAMTLETLEDPSIRQIRPPGTEQVVLQVAIRQNRLRVRTAPAHPPSGPQGPTDRTAAFRSFFDGAARDDSRSAWPPKRADRSMMEALVSDSDTPNAVGFVRPGRWLEEVVAEGQAATIRTRLARQLGPTGVQLVRGDSEGHWRLEIRNRAVSGEPTVVAGLGRATGSLPPVGGLVEPGVLGVLRISASPKALYRALESTLPAARREQVDVFWRHLDQKLLVEGPDKILDNFTGHAFFVFYGMEGDRLEGSGASLLRDVFELRATREAILLPIKSRAKAERLLDRMTQITKGRLSRQQSQQTVQYAWLDEGVLEWALILSDEYVLFVDSATALDKAKRYGKKGRPLSEKRRSKMGIGPLLENRQRSGFYLESAMLAELLRESGYPRAADLLGSFQTVVLTTESDEDGSTTRIRLRVPQP